MKHLWKYGENVVKKHLTGSVLDCRSSWILPMRDVLFVIISNLVLIYFSEYSDSLGWFLKNFISENKNLLDVYSISLTILFTVFIAVFIEMYRVFSDVAVFGSRLLLEEQLEWRRVAILIPVFSLTLFLGGGRDVSVLLNLFEFILWTTLFYRVSTLNVRLLKLIIDGKGGFFYALLESLKRQDVWSKEEDIFQRWRTVWGKWIDIGVEMKDEQRNAFLSLFWKKQWEFFGEGRHDLVGWLFENFSTQFLFEEETKGDQRELDERSDGRRRYLWFHNALFGNSKENPYGIFEKLLKFHYEAWKKKEELEARVMEEISPEESGYLNVSELLRKISVILEHIIQDELEHSGDFYYGLFRILKRHVDDNGKSEKYIESIPIYRAVFEHADTYDLSRYEPGEKNSTGFPNEWRILDGGTKNFSSIQVAWIKKFLQWSNERISHEAKPYDEKLSGALEMLFPESYQPWLALGIAYRYVSLGGDHIASLCKWQRNFGLESGVFMLFDWNQDISEVEKERERDRLMSERIESFQKNALKILERLGILDDAFKKSKETLESLRFEGNSNQEKNRKELLEMLKLYEPRNIQ